MKKNKYYAEYCIDGERGIICVSALSYELAEKAMVNYVKNVLEWNIKVEKYEDEKD